MSKPHLAIQNQAVKYAQKDINGHDIVQYDYVTAYIEMTITTASEDRYTLCLSGVYMDIKDNYKKLPPRDDLTFTDIIEWLIPLMYHQNYPAYFTGGDALSTPVMVSYDEYDKLLNIDYVAGESILHNIELDAITVESADIRINPLTDDIDIYEV